MFAHSVTLVFYAIFSDSDAQLLQLLANAYAPGTVKNIRSSIRLFLQFMITHNLTIFPPDTVNIAKYYASLLSRLTAMGSLLNHQSSVATFYRLHGYQVDTACIVFKLLNMSAKKSLSTTPAAKPPLELAHILRFKDILDQHNPTHLAFYNAVCIGFMATLRRSNICPPSVHLYNPDIHLRRQDIVFTPEGLIVVIRWSKTNQDSSKTFHIPIAYSGCQDFDPPSQFKQFIQAFPVAPHDPCFSFYQDGRLYVLTHPDLARMLASFLANIGVQSQGFTTHSIRKGGASIIHRAGVPTELLKQHGTWQSDAYQVYLQHSYTQKLSVSQAVYKLMNT